MSEQVTAPSRPLPAERWWASIRPCRRCLTRPESCRSRPAVAGTQPSRLTASRRAPRLSAVTTLAAPLNISRSCTSSFSSSETFSSGWSKSMSNTPAMATLRSLPPVTERKNSRSPPPHGNTHIAAITGYYTGHAHCETPKRGGTLSAMLLFWQSTSVVSGNPFPLVKGKKYRRHVKWWDPRIKMTR